jgi:hypothetical protein
MKNFLTILVLSISLCGVGFSQSKPVPKEVKRAAASTTGTNPYAVNAAFDAAYWASQPDAVRSAFQSGTGTNLANTATTLATQGYSIDVPIMVWGWDPWFVMNYRQSMGFTWVPSALQPNICAAPGLTTPSCPTPYDPNHPPAGSIKVSININDYPPFDPPVVTPANPTVTDFVGNLSYGCVYLALPGDPANDGATTTDTRGTFTKHKVAGLFGYSTWYTLNGCTQ